MKELQLNDIVFHDKSITKIHLESEEKLSLIILFETYDEESNGYLRNQLIFNDITHLNFNSFKLNRDFEINIASFDYSYDKEYTCRLQLTLGFGQPSVEIQINCISIRLFQDF